MFQVVELRKHQLTQAHVRAYTFQRKTEPGDVKPWFETHNMRISRPDDSNGAWMLMALPCLVSHGIDEWSPLWPPAFNKPNGLVKLSTLYPNIALRDDLVYGVGGGSAGGALVEQHVLMKHTRTSHRRESYLDTDHQRASLLSNIAHDTFTSANLSPTAIASNGGGSDSKSGADNSAPPNVHKYAGPAHLSLQEQREAMRKWFTQTRVEIIVIVEGNDQTMSSSVQARHSYSFVQGEILLDYSYDNCVSEGEDGNVWIDFDLFHSVSPAPLNHDRVERWLSFA